MSSSGSPGTGKTCLQISITQKGKAMARPAPLRDRRDRFRVVEDDNAPDDLLPAEDLEGDGAQTQAAAKARAHQRVETEWPAIVRAPDPEAAIPEAVDDDAAALTPDPLEIAVTQPEPIIETKPSPIKQNGEMSVISLALMALAAAGLSAAIVLFLF
jgi:hypothetical protein